MSSICLIYLCILPWTSSSNSVFGWGVPKTMSCNSLLVDTWFKNRNSRGQKLWFAISEGSFISEASSVLERLKGNITAVSSWMWDTIYNKNKNKEKQWTGYWYTLSSLKWKHGLERLFSRWKKNKKLSFFFLFGNCGIYY